MRILVVTPPLADPLPLTPYGLAVAEHHRGLGHSVHIHDPIPPALDGCLTPDAVTAGIEEGRRRFQSLERQHTLSADDAAIHRSLADTVPLAGEVTRRLPRARSHLFTREAWAPGGSDGWPSALADATILRVALALSRVRPADVAVDPGDLGSAETDRVVIAVSSPLQLDRGRVLAERIRRGGGEVVIVRAPWVESGGTAGPPEDVFDPEKAIDPRARTPVWAPWDPGVLPPRSYVWSLAAGGADPTPGPPGADVVGLELRLDPVNPDRELLRWAGETGLPLRLRVPEGWLDTARDDPLGELATREGVEIAAHLMSGTPGPGLRSHRPSLFRDRPESRTRPTDSGLGFPDAVRIVQAAGRRAYRDLVERHAQSLPVGPPPPDAVFGPNPDVVVTRLTHDPTRAPHRGGVGRTAGEQAAAGLAPGRGHPFVYDLTRRRRIPLSHPAHHVAAHVDGVRTVAEIARGLAGGSEDERLLARTVTVFSELESACVVIRT